MKKPFLVTLALLALVAALAVPVALSTTLPTLKGDIHVKITDTSVVLGRYREKRGVHITFVVKNFGKKPHAFNLGGLQTPKLMPGATAKLKSALDVRGKFPYKVTLNPAPAQHGFFTVY